MQSDSNRSLSSFVLDVEGNLVTVENIYHWDENTGNSSQEYYMCRYDAQGQKLSESDITEELQGDEEYTYVQGMALDGEGRIYLAGESAILLFDAEGNYCGAVNIGGDAWLNAIGAGKDGKMYAAVYEQNNGTVLREIDFDSRKEGASYGNFTYGNGNGLAAGEVLLNQESIYDFESIQLAEAMFQEDVTFISYPNDKGESGTYLTVDTGLAITSKSANKEGAWAFLEYYLNEENEYYDWGFSSKKDAFKAACEEATKVEYVTDENGEQMLDEDGNPIISGGGSSIGYGDDWTYEYHITTEEEVDKLEELISIATPSMDSDTEIMSIIKEEAQAFFKGQKTAADVASVIQSRVQVYVNENL